MVEKNIYFKLKNKAKFASSTSEQPKHKLVNCNVCGCAIRKDRLKKHVRKIHSETTSLHARKKAKKVNLRKTNWYKPGEGERNIYEESYLTSKNKIVRNGDKLSQSSSELNNQFKDKKTSDKEIKKKAKRKNTKYSIWLKNPAIIIKKKSKKKKLTGKRCRFCGSPARINETLCNECLPN
jgi:hypothetical protein